ncbi:MAG TPA: ROK family transcriptional regulator, partial [Longimicrobiaceae bacterium]|nr:ROK family transcriptional regulator [Longimicrobiaceae bacterium]
MRKINPQRFQRATRSTPREINEKIVLNLIREHQPISRAELARVMDVTRGTVTRLVDVLLRHGSIYEGKPATAPRGRRPTMLHVRTEGRLAVAIDVRFSRTFVVLADLSGNQIAMDTLPTPTDPAELVERLAERVRDLLEVHGADGGCEGIGLVVPGMVDRRAGRILNSPALGWKDVPLREMLSARTGLRAFIENGPVSCALAQMWLNPSRVDGVDDFAYVTVSDGVGVGVVVDGEVLRGHGDTAGEFGHLPLSMEGPRCLCGLRGCLEAHTSNLATLGRYLGLDPAEEPDREKLRRSGMSIPDLVARARGGDARATEALQQTARSLGIGLAGIVMALNPARIFLDGEVMA